MVEEGNESPGKDENPESKEEPNKGTEEPKEQPPEGPATEEEKSVRKKKKGSRSGSRLTLEASETQVKKEEAKEEKDTEEIQPEAAETVKPVPDDAPKPDKKGKKKKGDKKEEKASKKKDKASEEIQPEAGGAGEENANDAEEADKKEMETKEDKKGDKASKKKDKGKKEPASEPGEKDKKKDKKKKSAEAEKEEGPLPSQEKTLEDASGSFLKAKSVSSKSIDKDASSSAVKLAFSKSVDIVGSSSAVKTVPSKSVEVTKSEDLKEELAKRESKKSVTISEMKIGVEGLKTGIKKKGKKKKEKKVKKTSSSTEDVGKVAESDQGIAGKQKKKKGKQKKGETVKEGAEKEVKIKTLKKESSIKLKKGVSKSDSIIKKLKRSQSNLDQLMSRLSMHAAEMDELRRMSSMGRQSSTWTLAESSSTESSEESETSAVDKRISSTGAVKTKKGKGKKGKKGQKKKEPAEAEGEEGEPKKEKKKGKGKKGKEKEEKEPEPEDDVLAEINRMKYLATLAASGQDLAETAESIKAASIKQKKKKKKKKKIVEPELSKKEKLRLAAEQAEKAKISAEEAAAKAAELERIRLAEERKAAIEKQKKEGFEQQLRMEQLESAFEQFEDLVAYVNNMREAAKIQADWEFYVNCGRLPNPSKCDQMNTFLHLWENAIQETSMEEAARKTEDVLELLEELDDLIDTAKANDSDKVENWKWVRLLFRVQQAKSLDVATYRLLRNIEKNLHRIDIPTADYKYQDDNIALCLWLRIQLPTPLPNPRRPPKPRIEVQFPEMKMEVQYPPSIDGEKMAVRALYVKYDHLSDLSETYDKPPIPEHYDMDLHDAVRREWREKMLYKYKNRIRPPPPTVEEGAEGEGTEEVKDEVFPDDQEIPTVPYRKLEPTASEFVINNEEKLYKETRSALIKTVPDDVINLRKYSIIGGVYYLNLVHQPPQPQDFVTLEMNLTPLYLPKELELVDLYLDYSLPAVHEPNVRRPPEEIEEEMKKHEEELEKLVLVTLTWPEHVIFLELPMVCFWDAEQRVWSKQEVHDLKHNEEKGQLSFRTRKGAIFGLAVYRYANLPYQAWEMRPEAK
ncbi:axoneme-associated protein mst101(2)-like isoform X2 [Zophobas morio]|uniref:axoneme-associated protein mst101(2)-like isoform X2 n=1 Tax=Zophobas morio TaxID=2755281 RepID=UPI0030832D22